MGPLYSYYALEAKLAAIGFTNGNDEVLCRWRKNELLIDVMPMEELGFGSTNRWYPLVVKYSEVHILPRGGKIRVISAPLFVAAKLEAFQDRGEGNFGHHDIEDIVNIVDGRIELAQEIRRSDELVRAYIMEEFDDLLAEPDFTDHLPWHLNPDEANQQRVPMLLARFREIAGL